MEATHWINTVTHALQQGAQSLTPPARPLAEFFMPWLHELSITALAAAVVTLGCVMLLELRALATLRRNLDSHLARVFEQLDLMRFDHVQLLEAHMRHGGGLTPADAMGAAPAATTPKGAALPQSAVSGLSIPRALASAAPAAPAALASGEARLLASLAEARARRAEAIRAAASNL